MNFKSKLPQTGTTIFTEMSRLATDYQAVNLGQGFPDFPMDEELIDLVSTAMKNGMNQYAPMSGLPVLRERLAEKTLSLYGTAIDPETDVTITPGGTYAIYTALTTILQPGDEVIIFEPAYDSYLPNVLVNGARPVLISLQAPDFAIPWDQVKDNISNRTKAIIINSPHNPTGSVLRATDIEQLRQIIAAHPLFIISDEVYEHLIFDGLQHESMLRYPDLLQRSFVCFSFGKTYHCTGWKMGYCISSPKLMDEFRKIHQYNCFSCHTPSQAALAAHLQKRTYLQLAPFVQQKRDYFQHLMQQTPFQPLPSYGSYFQCYSYAGISNESDKELSIRLTKECGVTPIPLSAFYNSGKDDKIVRFCICKKEETLQKAVERLRRFTNS